MAPPVKTEVNADAVARSAQERLEKLEAENKALKARLDQPSTPAASRELEQLRDENEKLRIERRMLRAATEAAMENAVGSGRSKKAVVPGTKRYRLRQPHYRQGSYFSPGDIITVTDEVPGKTWVPLEAKVSTELVEAMQGEGEPVGEKRASDLSV